MFFQTLSALLIRSWTAPLPKVFVESWVCVKCCCAFVGNAAVQIEKLEKFCHQSRQISHNLFDLRFLWRHVKRSVVCMTVEPGETDALFASAVCEAV